MPRKRPKLPKRAAFATTVARPVKRTAGRTAAATTPAHIRTLGPRVDDALREHVRARLGRQLGKFAEHIERVSVRFVDENGPRGGIDVVCRVKVVLSGSESILVEHQDADAPVAADGALERIERAVRRKLDRTRSRRGRGRDKRAPL